ncbi:MAG: hypothetical protein IPJ65_40180 [Archangiaceae bacterium]|nr:hypothetical protein [Archangiaceae bacterium]
MAENADEHLAELGDDVQLARRLLGACACLGGLVGKLVRSQRRAHHVLVGLAQVAEARVGDDPLAGQIAIGGLALRGQRAGPLCPAAGALVLDLLIGFGALALERVARMWSAGVDAARACIASGRLDQLIRAVAGDPHHRVSRLLFGLAPRGEAVVGLVTLEAQARIGLLPVGLARVRDRLCGRCRSRPSTSSGAPSASRPRAVSSSTSMVMRRFTLTAARLEGRVEHR